MKISKNKIEFANGTIDLKTSMDGESRMDYILSMLADRIMSALKHLNREELWKEDPEMLQITLPLSAGTSQLSIINTGGNLVMAIVDGKIMEEADEYTLAHEFLQNVQADLPELLSDLKDQKYVYSQIKADLRSDLNHLELVLDRYDG